jgi:hypothetical protein
MHQIPAHIAAAAEALALATIAYYHSAQSGDSYRILCDAQNALAQACEAQAEQENQAIREYDDWKALQDLESGYKEFPRGEFPFIG